MSFQCYIGWGQQEMQYWKSMSSSAYFYMYDYFIIIMHVKTSCFVVGLAMTSKAELVSHSIAVNKPGQMFFKAGLVM